MKTNIYRHVGKCIAFLGLCTSSVFLSTGNAGPVEDDAFAAFEWFCLSHLNKIKAIPTLFDQIDVKPLTDQQAKPFLSPQSGKAWLLPNGQTHFVVMLTDKGTCTVLAPEAKGNVVKTLFENNTKNSKIRSEPLGSQTEDVYALTFPDPAGGNDGHAVVMITTSRLKSMDGVFLNALPEKLIRKDGMPIPKWP